MIWLTGNAVSAVSIIVAIYLLGLALGAAWARNTTASGPSAWRRLGLIELGVAITVSAGWIVARSPLVEWVLDFSSTAWWSDFAFRAIFMPAVLMPPTFLMGATIPLAVAALKPDAVTLRLTLPLVLGMNTLGGFAGCLLTCVLIFAWWGLDVAVAIGVGVSLIASGISLWMAWTTGFDRWSSPSQSRSLAPVVGAATTGQQHAPWMPIVIAVFSMGFVLLALEILWTRALTQLVGSSIYAFATILSVYLLAFAAGSLATSTVGRWLSSVYALGWQQLACAALVLSSVYVVTARMDEPFLPWLNWRDWEWSSWTLGKMIACVIVVAPTVFVGGLLTPAASLLAYSRTHRPARSVAIVSAAATLGSVVGVLVAGWLLIPKFGVVTSILACAFIISASGALCLLWQTMRHRLWQRVLAVAACAAVVVGAATTMHVRRPSLIAFADAGSPYDLLFERDDALCSVAVLQRRESGTRLLAIDGVIVGDQEGDTGDKQKILAHLPFVIAHEQVPQQILTIGLGTGILAGHVLRHGEVTQVDCVELSPAVVEAAHLFADANYGAMGDSRLHVHVADGVRFTRCTSSTYDAIISDGKSRTTHAGNSVFYSQEFYTACRERLSHNGCFVQWVPLDLAPEDLQTIVRTFAAAFPRGYLMASPPSSVFLVGAREPLTLALDRMQRQLRATPASELRTCGWGDATTVCSLVVSELEPMRPSLSGPCRLNRWAHPVLEYHSLHAYQQSDRSRNEANLALLSQWMQPTHAGVAFVGHKASQVPAYRRATRKLLLAQSDTPQGEVDDRATLRMVLRIAPAHSLAKFRMSQACHQVGMRSWREGRFERAYDELESAVTYAPYNLDACCSWGAFLLDAGQPRQAVEVLKRVTQLRPNDASARLQLAWSHGESGDLPSAIDQFQLVVRRIPKSPAAHLGLGIALWHSGRRTEAGHHLATACALYPGATADVQRITSQEASSAGAELAEWEDAPFD